MRRNKMGAVKLTAYVGTQECHFDSKAEYKYALYLEREKQAGRIFDWTHHPGVYVLNGLRGEPVGTMEPDFLVMLNDPDKYEVHEVKGMATASWRLKRKLFEQEHAGVKYVVVDAGQVDPPALFDERRKRKAERKRARKSPCKSPGKSPWKSTKARGGL